MAVTRTVVTATRRRADGGPSARSLLISVLGQWVGPSATPVWTSTLVGALEALGIEERAARQAVNRTAADGWLEGESVGRYTRWRLTGSGRRLIGSAPLPRCSVLVRSAPKAGSATAAANAAPPTPSAQRRLPVGKEKGCPLFMMSA